MKFVTIGCMLISFTLAFQEGDKFKLINPPDSRQKAPIAHLNRAQKVKAEPSDSVFINATLPEYYPDSAVESELAAGSTEDLNLDTEGLELTPDTHSTSSSSTNSTSNSTLSTLNQTSHSNFSSDDLDDTYLMQENAYDRMFETEDESAYSLIFLGYILIYTIA